MNFVQALWIFFLHTTCLIIFLYALLLGLSSNVFIKKYIIIYCKWHVSIVQNFLTQLISACTVSITYFILLFITNSNFFDKKALCAQLQNASTRDTLRNAMTYQKRLIWTRGAKESRMEATCDVVLYPMSNKLPGWCHFIIWL